MYEGLKFTLLRAREKEGIKHRRAIDVCFIIPRRGFALRSCVFSRIEMVEKKLFYVDVFAVLKLLPLSMADFVRNW